MHWRGPSVDGRTWQNLPHFALIFLSLPWSNYRSARWKWSTFVPCASCTSSGSGAFDHSLFPYTSIVGNWFFFFGWCSKIKRTLKRLRITIVKAVEVFPERKIELLRVDAFLKEFIHLVSLPHRTSIIQQNTILMWKRSSWRDFPVIEKWYGRSCMSCGIWKEHPNVGKKPHGQPAYPLSSRERKI